MHHWNASSLEPHPAKFSSGWCALHCSVCVGCMRVYLIHICAVRVVVDYWRNVNIYAIRCKQMLLSWMLCSNNMAVASCRIWGSVHQCWKYTLKKWSGSVNIRSGLDLNMWYSFPVAVEIHWSHVIKTWSLDPQINVACVNFLAI